MILEQKMTENKDKFVVIDDKSRMSYWESVKRRLTMEIIVLVAAGLEVLLYSSVYLFTETYSSPESDLVPPDLTNNETDQELSSIMSFQRFMADFIIDLMFCAVMAIGFFEKIYHVSYVYFIYAIYMYAMGSTPILLLLLMDKEVLATIAIITSGILTYKVLKVPKDANKKPQNICVQSDNSEEIQVKNPLSELNQAATKCDTLSSN